MALAYPTAKDDESGVFGCIQNEKLDTRGLSGFSGCAEHGSHVWCYGLCGVG